MTYDEGFAAGMRRAAQMCLETRDEALTESGPCSREIATWMKGQADAILAAIPAPAPWTPPEDRPDYPNDECPKCGGEGVDADPHGLFDGNFTKPCPSCWPAPEAKP